MGLDNIATKTQDAQDPFARHAPALYSEDGDEVFGIVKDITTREQEDPSREDYPIVTFVASDENPWNRKNTGKLKEGQPIEDGMLVAWHATQKIAKEELESEDPQRGDFIGVRREGKPRGKPYIVFRVITAPGPSSTPAPVNEDEPPF
jgi:hypothetical protein